jgi:phosphatidylinositol alpha-1,6-mannosyltransferase
VGRIHPRKGQALLLRALNQLPAELQRQIEVILAGPFTKSGYLSKIKSQSKNFKGRVIFTGDIHDHALRKQYQKADIFALTSTVQKNSVEGFGFVYLEASAHGLPIVANRIGGVEDTVLENKTGLLAEPNSLQSLSKKLEILATDPKLRAQLGGNGKKWAKSHSWEEITEKLYKFP